MPGNEVEDRVQNFFDQEKGTSESNSHQKILNRNWSRFRNDTWMGNKRHSATPFISNQKNLSLLQSVDASKRVVGNQFSNIPPATDYNQFAVRPEYFKSHPLTQESNLNGYVRENNPFIERHNDDNFMGIDTESDKRLFTPVGRPPLGLQHLKSNEPNTSFSGLDFYGPPGNVGGSHQQMSGLLGGRYSGFGDSHMLQQQAMFKHPQESRGQFHQMEARQHSSLNEFSSEKQAPNNFINNTPIPSIHGFEMTPELIANHYNWMQRCTSPATQGSSGRSILSADQRQTMGVMGKGMVSLHSDKPSVAVHASTGGGSFKQNTHIQDPAAVSTNVSGQGKLLFENSPMQDLLSGAMLENLSRVNASQGSTVINEFNSKSIPPFSESSSGVMPAFTPQCAPPPMLDPTEKEILFGTDDSIWNAFGGSPNMFSGSNNVNGAASLRSGSWSALMQSAVAESSSFNLSTREGFSGCLPDAGPRGVTTSGEVSNSGRQSKVWGDNDFNLHSSIGSKPWLNHGLVNACNDHDFARTARPSISQEHGKLHANVSGINLPKDELFGQNQIGKLPFEINSGSDHLSDMDMNAKVMSDSWNRQKNVSICSTSDRPGEQTGWKPVELMGISSAAVFIPQNTTDFCHLKKIDHNKISRDQTHHYGIADTQRSRKDVEILQSSREFSDMKNVSLTNDYSLKNINGVAVHPLPEYHRIDGQNCSDIIDERKRISDSGRSQYHLSNVPCFLDQLTAKGRTKVHQMGDACDKHELSSDSFHSSSSNNASTAGLRDAACLNASDSLVTSRDKQFDSSASNKMAASHYHPIGNVDMHLDPSDKSRSNVHTHGVLEKVSQRLKTSASEHSEFPSGVSRSFEENIKGQLSKHGDKNEAPPMRFSTGCMLNSSTPVERCISNYSAMNVANPSENMLDLLHKVDQSGGYGSNVCFNNRLAEIPDADTSDGSDSNFNKSRFLSQQFCLQLGPPSENMSRPNHPFSPQRHSWAINAPNAGQTKVMGNMFVSTSSFQPLPFESSQEFINSKISLPRQDHDSLTQASKPCFLYSDDLIQNQCMVESNEGIKVNQSMDPSCSPSSFGQMNSTPTQIRSCHPTEGLLTHLPSEVRNRNSVPSLDHSLQSDLKNSHVGVWVENNTNIDRDKASLVPLVPGSHRNQSPGITNMWIDVSTATNPSVPDPLKDASNMCTPKSQCSSETMSSTQNIDGADDCEDVHAPCDTAECYSMDSDGDICQEEQQSVEGFWNQAPSENFNLAQTEAETLQTKSAAIFRLDNCSTPVLQRSGLTLLPQTRTTTCSGEDSDDRESKRLKVTDSAHVSLSETPLVSRHEARVEDDPPAPAPIQNKNVGNLSAHGKYIHDESVTCHDSLPDQYLGGRGILNAGTCSQNLLFSRTEPPNIISPQIAPSWFDPHANHKKTSESSNIPLVAAERHSESSIIPCMGTPDFHSSDVIPADLANQTSVAAVSEKCTSVALSFTPWSKQMKWDSQRINDISIAEIDWARAFNCIVHKNEDIDIVDDRQELPKKRLILANQMMQQILRCPLQPLISADDWSDYENMVYLVSRSVLGDACCLSAHSSNYRTAPFSNDGNADISKTEKVSGNSLSEAVEDLISRTKKVQNELFRLEKSGGTMVEVGVEWEEIDRFSVINRFAKFHGRSQGEGTVGGSSSQQPSLCQKTFLQRYVTALPTAPATIPNSRVQCLVPL